MSRLLQRAAAFQAKAQEGPVQVRVYGTDTSPGLRSLRKLALFATLLASGAALNSVSEIGNPMAANANGAGAAMSQPKAVPNCEPKESAPEPQATKPEIKLVEIVYLGKKVLAIDEASRIRLSKEAAQANNLAQVGLDWRDLYGVINAETAWVPRTGMGANGVQSHGLAQFEPATAKAMGVDDPHDHEQALHGAAQLLKEAALWSKSKLAALKLPKSVFAEKLREGISVYYNLSSAGRRAWNGQNAHELPQATQHHIANAKDGRLLAAIVDKKVQRLQAQNIQTEQPASMYPVSIEAGRKGDASGASRCERAAPMTTALACKMNPSLNRQECLDIVLPDHASGKMTMLTTAHGVALAQNAQQTLASPGLSWRTVHQGVFQETQFNVAKLLERGPSATAGFLDVATDVSYAHQWAMGRMGIKYDALASASKPLQEDRAANKTLAYASAVALYNTEPTGVLRRFDAQRPVDLVSDRTLQSVLLAYRANAVPGAIDRLVQAVASDSQEESSRFASRLLVDQALELAMAMSTPAHQGLAKANSNAQVIQALAQHGHSLESINTLYQQAARALHNNQMAMDETSDDAAQETAATYA